MISLAVCSDRTRRNGFKLEDGKSRLNVQKTFFTIRTEAVA